MITNRIRGRTAAGAAAETGAAEDTAVISLGLKMSLKKVEQLSKSSSSSRSETSLLFPQ